MKNPQDLVTQNISLEEVLELQKAFKLFDRDNTGVIEGKDLINIFELGELPSSNFYFLVQWVWNKSIEGISFLDFQQFFSLMTKKQQEHPTRQNICQLFSTFDPESKGFISMDGLKKGVTKMGQPILMNEILEIMMKNQNGQSEGQISFEQFESKLGLERY